MEKAATERLFFRQMNVIIRISFFQLSSNVTVIGLVGDFESSRRIEEQEAFCLFVRLNAVLSSVQSNPEPDNKEASNIQYNYKRKK